MSYLCYFEIFNITLNTVKKDGSKFIFIHHIFQFFMTRFPFQDISHISMCPSIFNYRHMYTVYVQLIYLPSFRSITFCLTTYILRFAKIDAWILFMLSVFLLWFQVQIFFCLPRLHYSLSGFRSRTVRMAVCVPRFAKIDAWFYPGKMWSTAHRECSLRKVDTDPNGGTFYYDEEIG